VLHNILDAGFTGNVYVVNPNRPNVQGLPCVPTAAELPEAPDLAVIALPAGQVLDAVRACGERGGRSAILLGSGFGESGADGVQLQDAVLRAARDYGMRLVGPNCIGVLNTDPTVRLDATFARLSRRPGNVAVLAQSGAFGIAVLHAMDEFGLGVSQFVSVGNKADVGGNDLLLAWERDSHTDVIAMYLESVGDPRRFARIAGQVARRKPILAIKSGRTEVGRRAGRSHTAAAASSDVAIDALFRRSGVLRMQSMGELVDTARLLAGQPLPTGPRVAIVGNSGGPEILAADAASDAGLVITEFGDTTRTTLRTLGAPDQNPLDLGAAAGDRLVARVMTTVLASPDVDAVLTVFTEVAISDAEAISRAITQAAAEAAKPVLSVAVGEHGAMHPVPGTAHAVPVYTFPEQAAAALGTAYRYSRIRTASMSLPDRPDGIDREAARAVVRTALLDGREWLTAREAYRLLVAYALPMCPQEIVTGVGSAAAAAVRLGYPVAAKLAEPGLHKSDVGGVRLGIADETALRTAVDQLRAVSANANPQVLLQPMITGGTELIVGAVHDPQCGPLVMLGAGGVLTDVLGDRAFALAPLADADADDLIDSLRSSRLLDGYRGAPRVSRGAVRDVLVRVAALVDDVPQIAELDLNPLVCTADGVHTIDARIRVAPPPHHPDPLVRQIRGPVRPKA
jgi:acyl-CoA synthetase (NDP forming)